MARVSYPKVISRRIIGKAYRQTPVEWSVQYGHEAIVRLFLDHAGMPDLWKSKGGLLLGVARHLSSTPGYQSILRLLLEYEAKHGCGGTNPEAPYGCFNPSE